MELSQLCAANYHYKRYTLDYFLESAERLGYQSIELWASGPHLHLEDFDAARLAELNRKIKAHHLALRCFTPEQCVYAISVSHPDKVYRDRTVDFFNQHIEAAVQLDCDHMVVSTGFAYLDVDAEDAFGWCAEAMGRIARKAEQEGVTLAVEPLPSTPPTSAMRQASCAVCCALSTARALWAWRIRMSSPRRRWIPSPPSLM